MAKATAATEMDAKKVVRDMPADVVTFDFSSWLAVSNPGTMLVLLAMVSRS